MEYAADFEEEESVIYPGEKMSTKKRPTTFGIFLNYRINKLKDERPEITYIEARKVASEEWIKYDILSLLSAEEA